MLMIETERLILSEFSSNDAPFILEMLNDPAWLQFIGDRGVKTLDDARDYIVNKLQKSFKELGFGMLIVKLKDGGISIGTCGLLKRDYLEDLDLGFAFLPEFRAKGYAYEAASATIEYGKKNLGLKHILAFTDADNSASINLIKKLGLGFERLIDFPDDDAEIQLYGVDT
ncbi:MAG: GNAT family N-acetyltransferase [Anaerolineae bacterium]|nr:GNAT family N-acetyltransferase [Anaerolineae bacterium]